MSVLKALDPGVLDNVPVEPQPVGQSGAVPGADQRARPGAALLSPRNQMDVSVQTLEQLAADIRPAPHSVVCSVIGGAEISHDRQFLTLICT